MSPAAQTLLEEIDAMVADRNLLRHTFYKAWSNGELSLGTLRDYAKQYYHHVAAFPTYLSAVHSNTNDITTRRFILSNLIDEEAGTPNHPELWLDFAQGLGVRAAEVESTDPWPETKHLVDTFRTACRDGNTAQGIASLYAYESQIPDIAESKISGLKRFYNVTGPKELSYFEIHKEADREHSSVERKLLGNHADEQSAPAIKKSVEAVLNALWGILSGVCLRHGIPA